MHVGSGKLYFSQTLMDCHWIDLNFQFKGENYPLTTRKIVNADLRDFFFLFCNTALSKLMVIEESYVTFKYHNIGVNVKTKINLISSESLYLLSKYSPHPLTNPGCLKIQRKTQIKNSTATATSWKLKDPNSLHLFSRI